MTRHEHQWQQFATFHHAPTGPPPQHTMFVVMTCTEPGCRQVELFPMQNFALVTDEFQTTVRAMLHVANLDVRF